jgi:cobalamin biosynthesis protein CbiD
MLYPFFVKFNCASICDIDVNQLNLISAKAKQLNFLKQEIIYKRISEQLFDKLLQSKISAFNNKIVDTICFEFPNAFWHIKKHIVSLPYVKDFAENKIPTKAKPIQMNVEILDFCQKKKKIVDDVR